MWEGSLPPLSHFFPSEKELLSLSHRKSSDETLRPVGCNFLVSLITGQPRQVLGWQSPLSLFGSQGTLTCSWRLLRAECPEVPAPMQTCSGRALQWLHMGHALPVLLGGGLQPRWSWLGAWAWTLLCRPIPILQALSLFLSLSLWCSHTISPHSPSFPFSLSPPSTPECDVVGSPTVPQVLSLIWGSKRLWKQSVIRLKQTHPAVKLDVSWQEAIQ